MCLLCVQGKCVASMRFGGWEKWCRNGIRGVAWGAILAKKVGVARFMQNNYYLCNG